MRKRAYNYVNVSHNLVFIFSSFAFYWTIYAEKNLIPSKKTACYDRLFRW